MVFAWLSGFFSSDYLINWFGVKLGWAKVRVGLEKNPKKLGRPQYFYIDYKII